MSGADALTIAIAILVALAVLALFVTPRPHESNSALARETMNRDRTDTPVTDKAEPVSGREVERQAALARRSAGKDVEPAAKAAPTTHVAPDAETMGVTRRQFFNRSIVSIFGIGLSGLGGAMLAFLWPQGVAGFGSKIRVGPLDGILGTVQRTRLPVYVPEGRFYVNPYPKEHVDDARGVYSDAVVPGLEAGVVALYQKCTHLGCRVPWCETSQWFECPCHGSQFNRVGEKKGGPAPRGLDRFPVAIEAGAVVVDTGTIVLGPPIGTNTTGQEAEGPHCAAAGGGN